MDSPGRTLTPNGDVSVTPAGWRAEMDWREFSLADCARGSDGRSAAGGREEGAARTLQEESWSTLRAARGGGMG